MLIFTFSLEWYLATRMKGIVNRHEYIIPADNDVKTAVSLLFVNANRNMPTL